VLRVVRNHHLKSSVSGEHCDHDKDLGQLLISQSRAHLDVIQIQVYGNQTGLVCYETDVGML
jgi:hypothetical protein